MSSTKEPEVSRKSLSIHSTGVPALDSLQPDATEQDRLMAMSVALADEMDCLLAVRSRLLTISTEINRLRR